MPMEVIGTIVCGMVEQFGGVFKFLSEFRYIIPHPMIDRIRFQGVIKGIQGSGSYLWDQKPVSKAKGSKGIQNQNGKNEKEKIFSSRFWNADKIIGKIRKTVCSKWNFWSIISEKYKHISFRWFLFCRLNYTTKRCCLYFLFCWKSKKVVNWWIIKITPLKYVLLLQTATECSFL